MDKNISIIVNYCWGGITYHYFGHEFLSPFVNLFCKDDHYLKLLNNFEAYMKMPLKFSEMIYDVATNGSDCPYPIGKLGDINIYFNHYINWEEAKNKWDSRKIKLNMQNLYFVMITSSQKSSIKFAELPFDRKLCFVPFETDIPHTVNVNTFNKWKDGITVLSNCDLAFARFMNRIAMGRYKFYDPWDLLLYNKLTKLVE